jgi:uncharacterized membrane protein
MQNVKRVLIGGFFLLGGVLLLGFMLVATASIAVTLTGWSGVSRYWYAMFSGYYGGAGFLVLTLLAAVMILGGIVLLLIELVSPGGRHAARHPIRDDGYEYDEDA